MYLRLAILALVSSIQAAGVVTAKLAELATLLVTFGEVLVVVQGAVVCRNTVEVAHIYRLGAFLIGEQGLIHFSPGI